MGDKVLPDATGRVYRLLREDQAASAIDGVGAYLSCLAIKEDTLREPPGKERVPGAIALLRLLDPLVENL